MTIYHQRPSVTVHFGDALEVLRQLETASVDALVTDPPSGISFMGKSWDSDKGGRAQWVAWLASVLAECRRVMKPGAHALVWAIPRTSHWTATAVEDAGFEVRDVITHHFGQGFAKSLNLGDGHGTGLKPASEHWILARAPFKGSVKRCVEVNGTGALSIDACRISSGADHAEKCASVVGLDSNRNGATYGEWAGERTNSHHKGGRWPANAVFSHTPLCEERGTQRAKVHWSKPTQRTTSASWLGTRTKAEDKPIGYADDDGLETVEVWECVEGCPVLELDRQSGERRSSGVYQNVGQGTGNGVTYMTVKPAGAMYEDGGGASRFFYVAKPSPRERDLYLDGLQRKSGGEATGRKDGSAGLKSPRAGAGRLGGRKNDHETVKPVALMSYLCRLICPPGGVVLDPFCGSGTTGMAALLEGFRFVGIDENESHCDKAVRRMARERLL